MRRVLVAIFIALLALVPAIGTSAGGPPQDLQGRALGLFDIDGVVFTDINEASGRLVVGVANLGLARSVEARANALGIPVSEMDVVETQPIVFADTLRSPAVRPIEGGLQIAFEVKKKVTTSTFLCSLGFNADMVTTLGTIHGFVTASHCTAKQGVVENTQHYQPTVSADNLIGTETADASFSPCLPPVKGKKKCLDADVAFDTRAAGVTANLGSIAKTTAPDGVSLDITGSFTIMGEAGGNAGVGTTLNKVGRTTGWTQGAVTNSCVDVAVL
ncbi:MAG: hypothetical protein AAB037_01810, partial [Chloroflexota bacterium]